MDLTVIIGILIIIGVAFFCGILGMVFMGFYFIAKATFMMVKVCLFSFGFVIGKLRGNT